MRDHLRIFLVRHGESVGNLDRSVYRILPDHKIPLSPYGITQAEAAGRALRSWLEQHPPSQRCRLWHSPYARTVGTTEGVVKELGLRENGGFIDDVRPNLHLIEQRFGLFDGLWDDEMEAQFPKEYEHFQRTRRHEGRFWAMMPEGDSPYDVAMRVHQSFGTFHRDARTGVHDIVLVSHGVTLRAFVMMWLHLGPDWFEQEPNPKNASIRLIEGASGEGWVDRGYLFEGFEKRPEVMRNEEARPAAGAPGR